MKIAFSVCFAASGYRGSAHPSSESGTAKLLPGNYAQYLNIKLPEL